MWRSRVSRHLFLVEVEARKGASSKRKGEGGKEVLRGALRKVCELVGEARSYPRPEEDRPTCTLKEVIEDLRKDKEVYSRYLRLPELESLFPVRTSGVTVRSILQTLIDNAVEAIHSRRDLRKKGHVTVEVVSVEPHVEVIVSDNGPGIPEEIARQIFQGPVKGGKGTGMMLLVSRGAALAAGGDLSLEERRGGAQFKLRLPVAPNP